MWIWVQQNYSDPLEIRIRIRHTDLKVTFVDSVAELYEDMYSMLHTQHDTVT